MDTGEMDTGDTDTGRIDTGDMDAPPLQPDSAVVLPPPAAALPRWFRIGLPSVLFGVIDAALVALGGKPLTSAVAAGTVLGAFIALVLVRRDRARLAREAGAGDGPQAGSWANPSSTQRWVHRLRKLTSLTGSTGNPLDRGRPPRR